MKSRILNLGILLLTILLVVLTGSLTLLMNNNVNDLFGIGLIVILLLVIVTFISYLFIDLYNSKEDNEESDTKASPETITHYRNLSDT